jgi:thioredoxin reductase (NADPH)
MQAKNAGAEINCDEEALNIDEEDHFIDACMPNVHYKLERPREFRRKRVVIVGGGDHAFDTAVQLKDATKKTTVLVRDKYAKAKRKTVELAEDLGLQILYNTEIVKVFKDKDGKLSKIQIANRRTEEKDTINVDELFVAIGFEPIKSFLKNNGFKLRKEGSVRVNRSLQTNLTNVFAAGDVTGEVRLIATACAEGIVAAVHAFEDIKEPYWLQ